MNTAERGEDAKALIDALSGPQLRVAAEFLAFVSRRDLDAATLELLSIPGFEKSCEKGMKAIRSGQTRSWRKVRSDV